MNKEEIIKRVLEMLEKQKFADWYNTGNFDRFITGDMKHKTGKSENECLEEIRNDIAKLLQLN